MRPIIPTFETVKVKGRVYWNDGIRKILLKRPIRQMFTLLNDRSINVSYEMELYLDIKKCQKRVKESLNEGIVPVLLFFYKDKPKEA